jgi:hypothetical protein
LDNDFLELLRKEHRWILHNNDIAGTLSNLNGYLVDPTASNIDSLDHYGYKTYLPLDLNDPTLVQWERDGSDLWSRDLVNPEDYSTE